MNWLYLVGFGTTISLQIITLIQSKRIQNKMATDFASVLAEAKAQGEQLDKVLAEVKAGNASAVTPEQLEELKSVLDANQSKLQEVDDIHPDTGAGNGETQPEQPTPDEPAPPAEGDEQPQG